MQKEKVFFSANKFENMTDEQIIIEIQKGDQQAISYLMDKYKELVNMKVSKYFMIGAEREDIVQEGLIGLFKAIKTFKKEKNSSFKSFANMCIERQLISAIKTSYRQKHIPLNSYINQMEENIEKTLSNFEKQVLDGYVKGYSYVTIAQKLDSPVKSVDNAIQRIRKKAVKNFWGF